MPAQIPQQPITYTAVQQQPQQPQQQQHMDTHSPAPTNPQQPQAITQIDSKFKEYYKGYLVRSVNMLRCKNKIVVYVSCVGMCFVRDLSSMYEKKTSIQEMYGYLHFVVCCCISVYLLTIFLFFLLVFSH